MKFYDFTNLPAEVQHRFGSHPGASFFNLPEWYRLVAECGMDRGWQAKLAVSDDGNLALACSQASENTELRSCTNLYTCAFDPMGDTVDAQRVRAFAEELASSVGARALLFEGLGPDVAYFPALLEGFRTAGCVAKPFLGWATWFEVTSGIDFEGFLSTRPSVLRNTWKRKRAALAKSAATRFRFYTPGDDPSPLIATYEKVREQSWKQPEPFPAFIPGLIRLAARLNALRLGILDIDGVPAAAQFWLLWGRRATIFKLVHAERFAAFSPGTLLTMEMLRTVLPSDQPSEIDFGRGDDKYKRLWLSGRRERWGIEAVNPRNWRGFAQALRIRAALARDRTMRKSGVTAVAASGTGHPRTI